jgi:hypothetical protein
MVTLRIEHSVVSFDDWKRAFDNDPVDRHGGGVRRYRIQRPVDDPSYVIVDLELDTLETAERFLQRLQQLWAGPAKAVVRNPKARILETAQAKDVTERTNDARP